MLIQKPFSLPQHGTFSFSCVSVFALTERKNRNTKRRNSVACCSSFIVLRSSLLDLRDAVFRLDIEQAVLFMLLPIQPA